LWRALVNAFAWRVLQESMVRRTSFVGLGKQNGLQPGFHGWPLRIEDAEVDGVPNAAARRDHMVAEGALFARADAQNGGAGFFVERVRFQFHTHAAEYFKGVLQEKIFCFRVDRAPLPGRGDPRPADFDAMMRAVDVAVACAANGAAAGFFD